MNITFIKSNEKKRILEKLRETYGIEKLPYLLISSGKDKVRGFSGSLSKEEILKLNQVLRIETLGTYLLKKEKDGLRLSFDVPTILDIKKNIIEVSDEQTQDWLKGKNIEINQNVRNAGMDCISEHPKIPKNKQEFFDLKGFVVLKNKENFVGCGKASDKRITNFVPKERRIRS
ncbi:MAG: hypothetical protein ABIG37_00795 [Nanoarchaeota archaeon]|nr:hypothetical protein [Nanoarchaeota archaeon]